MSASPSDSALNDTSALVEGASVLQKPTARFEWKALLDEGATGRVHLVRDHWVSRDVVLKQVLPRFLEEERVLQRFFQKLSLTRPLLHPNLVPYYELHFFQLRWKYTDEEGKSQVVMDAPSYYLSLPQLPTSSLDLLLEEKHREAEHEPPLFNLEVVRNLFFQIGEALSYSHEQGVTHDGLTSASVLCDLGGGSAPVTSYLSGHWFSVDLQRYENSHNRRLPSLLYMPPEQLKLIPHHGRLQQHDLFALGIILYQLLTGSYPYYHHDEMEAFVQGDMDSRPGIVVIDRYRRLLQGKESLGDTPRSVIDTRQMMNLPFSEHLNPDIEAAVMRCISLDPDVRPSSARELLEMFDGPWSKAELRRSEELRTAKGEIRKLIHMGDLDLAIDELEIAVEDFPEDEEIRFMNLTIQGLQALQMEQRQSQEEIRQVHSEMKKVRKEASQHKARVRAEVQESQLKAKQLEKDLETAHQRLESFENELIKRNSEKKGLLEELEKEQSRRKLDQQELKQLRSQLQSQVDMVDSVSLDRDRLEIEARRRKKELVTAVALVFALLIISAWSFLRPKDGPSGTNPLVSGLKNKKTPKQTIKRRVPPARRVTKPAARVAARTTPEPRRTTPEPRRTTPAPRRVANATAPKRANPPAAARRRAVPPRRASMSTTPGGLFASRTLKFASGELQPGKRCYRRGYIYGCFRVCRKWSPQRVCLQRDKETSCGCIRDVPPARVFPRLVKLDGNLSSRQFRRYLRWQRPTLLACADKAWKSFPKNSRKTGLYEVSWGTDRRVSDINIKSDNYNNTDVKRCLAQKVRTWRRPGPAGRSVKTTLSMVVRVYPGMPVPWDRNCGKRLLFNCFKTCLQRVRRNGRRVCLKYGNRCGCVRKK